MNYFRKYPVAVIFLILYNLIGGIILRGSYMVHERMRDNPGMSNIAAGGEGVSYSFFLFMLIAVSMILANFTWAFGLMMKKQSGDFHLAICGTVIAEMFIVLNISG